MVMLYFDHNATTPLLPAARAAWLRANRQFPGNPSSPHRIGARADAALSATREKLARVLGCGRLDVIWTSGATESANTVLQHFARVLKPQTKVWISAIEHPCVQAAARYYFPRRHRLIPVTRSGVVDLGWLERQFKRRRPGLVAVMAANNETGVLQPWPEVLALCGRWQVPFFCDAAQWIGKLPAAGLGACDFVSGSAHKFGGPKGVGFLKVVARGSFEPLLRGGPQEEGRRAGTENVGGVLAMLAALEEREHRLAQGEHRQRLAWREQFEQRLIAALPGTEIVGAGAPRLWNTVSALMPAAKNPQRWVVKVDKAGCAVSTGSACSSGREKASHVLDAMGRGARTAGRVLRFSSGWETTAADWDQLFYILRRVNRELAGQGSSVSRL
jgi:cysteine desulfurase